MINSQNAFFDSDGLSRLKKSFRSLHTAVDRKLQILFINLDETYLLPHFLIELNHSEGDLVFSLDNLAGINATNSLTQDYDPVISESSVISKV